MPPGHLHLYLQWLSRDNTGITLTVNKIKIDCNKTIKLMLKNAKININQFARKYWFSSALSVLMLCTPVFIFTSGSSALLGRPRCGSSIWLSLLAIFNAFFWVYANFFSRENRQNTKVLEVRLFVWCENGCRRWKAVPFSYCSWEGVLVVTSLVACWCSM